MAKVRVGIDISSMNKMSRMRGIGFYTTYLSESLRKYTDIEPILIENKSKLKLDLKHYPYFDLFNNTLPLFKKMPTVVTIHDVTPLVFSSHYPPGIKGKVNLKLQKISLKNVSAVITDSKASKEDILKFLPMLEEKIFVTYLAPADRFRVIKDTKKLEAFKSKHNLPKTFVLYVGNINWNKNLLNMAEAAIKSKVNLVLVGSGFDTKSNLNHPELKDFKRFMDKFSKNEYIKILGYLENEEIVEIMNLASVLLLPSFYEGFGLTILEAQACGVPVVTSTTSSMPEVAGGGALFVSPESVEEISAAILRVINNKELSEDLKLKGFLNVKKFSWKKCAEETAKVYERVLSRNF